MPIQIGAKGATIAGKPYPPYAYIDWLTPDQEALAIQGGDAYSVPKRGFTLAEETALRGVVSEAGNLAYAAVASTTGTPGEVRKLSDGPDKGACLVWSIPEGKSTYAWCWQIYPLASYL